MQLCAFSKSTIHADKILAQCPLKLNHNEAKKCPCRKRLYKVPPNDLRVLSCTFPDDWRGRPIHSPEGLRLSIQGKTKGRFKQMTAEASTQTAESQQARSVKEAVTQQASNSRSTALTLSAYDRISDPSDFIKNMGLAICESHMFGCSNVHQGRIFALECLTQKVSPLALQRKYHLLGGTLTMKADAMIAEFRARLGGSHKIIKRTPDEASIQLVLDKQKETFAFTWKEAQQEEYVYTKDANAGKVKKFLENGEVNPLALKDNWSTPRRRMQMLWARVVSDGVHTMAPEVVQGYYTPEEMGGAPLDAQNPEDVIDAEFTVVDEQPAAEKASAPDEPGPQATAKESPAQAQAAGPSGPPFDAGQAAAPAAAQEQPPAAAPADERKLALLKELKPLKQELLTDEQYKAVIEKYGVKSARDLSIENLERIVVGLQRRHDEKAKRDELSKWAENAAKGGPQGN